MDNVTCKWPGNSEPQAVGSPMLDAVYRSNHGLHPLIMQTQEPLWNDTVSRYFMLRESILAGGVLSADAAVNITSLLGMKGKKYGSCDRENVGKVQPGDMAIVLSVVYDPSESTAYVAWEDGHLQTWLPASCSSYLALNLGNWW